jgi:arginyl-tRNA synthetase
MNLIESIEQSLRQFIVQQFAVSNEQLASITLEINIDEAKQQFGDLNSNAALMLSKVVKKNPQIITQTIATQFKNSHCAKIEVAGPGFLNFFLTQQAFTELAQTIFTTKNSFFMLDQKAPHKKVSLEFVSANPTGPLHLGHGRGAIIGDVLGNVLKFIGHQVTKEFYINDAGAQMQKLGNSLKIRCQQLLGQDVQLPEDGYQGEYLMDIAKECVTTHSKDVIQQPIEFFSAFAEERLLANIKTTLASYGVTFDVWFSEKKLHNDSSITREIKELSEHNHTYEKDGALWFKSTEFGDDKDRVLRKASGELTYVAADIAYLDNKIHRGFDHLIMVLGQDHHSYVVRLKGILQAMGHNPAMLDIILYQLVTLKESGALVRMSKRAGKMITLKDIIETVGTDVARFFYLNRKADAHLEFDIDLALKKTDENPVYYIQYAYVRINSILEKAQEQPELRNITQTDVSFTGASEHLLIKKIVSLKQLLFSISTNNQTHLLTYYALELAHLFHKYYSHNRVIDTEHIQQSRGRLAAILLLKQTFETTLDLLGISKPDKM